MNRRYVVAGATLMTLCLASWVAIAMAQPDPGVLPTEPGFPEGSPTIPTVPSEPSPIPRVPTEIPTTPTLPTGPDSVPSFPNYPRPGAGSPTPTPSPVPSDPGVPSVPPPTAPQPIGPGSAPREPLPELPGEGGTPTIPVTTPEPPSLPGLPEAPTGPESPTLPGTPEAPLVPETPESPSGPESPTPATPGVEGGTGLPGSLPTIGGTGEQPTMTPVGQPTVSNITPSNPLGRQEPCVSIEWIGPPTAKVGKNIEYSLVVRNSGLVPVQQVLVRVRMPATLGVLATEPKAVADATLYTWDLGTLMSKQERVLKMKLHTKDRGDSMPQAWVTFTGSSVARIRVREPKLVLKASAPQKVLVGDAVAFTLSVSNPGDGAADRVKIRAALSEGLEHARGNTVDFEIGNLAAGETRSVQVICAAKGGGVQKCEGYAEDVSGLKSNDSATVNVIKPYLDLQLVGPGLRYLERKAIYTLQVNNPGDAPATNVTVSHQVPVGFKVLAASDGGRHDFSTRTVSWFLGEVAPGKTREVKLEVKAINPGVHVHKANAIGARGLRAEAETKTRVEGLSAIMLEMVDTEDPIEVNAETAYEIRITNTGSKTENNIKLVAIIPDEMEFSGAKGPVRYRAEGKTVVFDALPKLAPRADAIFRLNVKAKNPAIVRFEIRVTSANLVEPVIKMEPTRIYSDAPVEVDATPKPPR